MYKSNSAETLKWKLSKCKKKKKKSTSKLEISYEGTLPGDHNTSVDKNNPSSWPRTCRSHSWTGDSKLSKKKQNSLLIAPFNKHNVSVSKDMNLAQQKSKTKPNSRHSPAQRPKSKEDKKLWRPKSDAKNKSFSHYKPMRAKNSAFSSRYFSGQHDITANEWVGLMWQIKRDRVLASQEDRISHSVIEHLDAGDDQATFECDDGLFSKPKVESWLGADKSTEGHRGRFS